MHAPSQGVHCFLVPCKVIRLIALLFAELGSGVFPKGGYSHGMYFFEAIPENQ